MMKRRMFLLSLIGVPVVAVVAKADPLSKYQELLPLQSEINRLSAECLQIVKAAINPPQLPAYVLRYATYMFHKMDAVSSSLRVEAFHLPVPNRPELCDK